MTPSFNQAQYLERTLRSVLGQNYPHLEYIVRDGGSTDGSVEIIKRYQDKMAHWESGPDGGHPQAVAKGFELSTGEILGFLNSDDVFLPGCLHKVGRYFAAHPRTEVLSGGAYYIDADDKVLRLGRGGYTLGVKATFNRFRFYGQAGVFQPATFWRREAYFAVGGINGNFPYIFDLDFFIRLARRRRFDRLPELLACFRCHPAQKTARLHSVEMAELEKFRQLYINDRKSRLLAPILGRWYRGQAKARRLLLFLRDAMGLIAFPEVFPPDGRDNS